MCKFKHFLTRKILQHSLYCKRDLSKAQFHTFVFSGSSDALKTDKSFSLCIRFCRSCRNALGEIPPKVSMYYFHRVLLSVSYYCFNILPLQAFYFRKNTSEIQNLPISESKCIPVMENTQLPIPGQPASPAWY